MAVHGHICLFMDVKDLIWSNITEYSSTFTYMAENDQVWPDIDVYGRTWPYVGRT